MGNGHRFAGWKKDIRYGLGIFGDNNLSEDKKMYGYISGISENDEIEFCPKCGETIKQFYSDGTAKCDNCDYRFGVIECE